MRLFGKKGLKKIVSIAICMAFLFNTNVMALGDESNAKDSVETTTVETVTLPADGEIAPPADGVVAPPVDGEIVPPADGVVTPPADGEIIPPADGVVAPPADGEIIPPADGVVAPPADGEIIPPVDGMVTPPVDEEIAPPVEENVDQTQNGDVIRNTAPYQYKLVGDQTIRTLGDGEKLDLTNVDFFAASYTFKLKDQYDEDENLSRTMKAGDFYYIELPASVNVLGQPENYLIKADKTDEVIARFEIEGDRIKVTFEEFVNDMTRINIFGKFAIEFKLDASGIGNGEEVVFPMDDADIIIENTKPSTPSTEPTKISKKGTLNKAKKEITWTVSLDTPATADWSGWTFTDKVNPAEMTITGMKLGTVVVSDYQYDAATGILTYLIPAATTAKTITIITKVSDVVFHKGNEQTLKNNAELAQSPGKKPLTATASVTIGSNWITKTGANFDGKRIDWTITVNKDKKLMRNAVVTDTLNDKLELYGNTIKVNAKEITLQKVGYVPTDANEIYATLDGKTITCYLPRGDNFSKDTYTIVISTTPIPQKLKAAMYDNSAFMTGEYQLPDGETGNIVQETEKVVAVGKTESGPDIFIDKAMGTRSFDKVNSTVEWFLRFGANQTEYDKTSITDTLPDGLTYIEDTITYKNAFTNKVTKLTAETEPKAEISNNGKTLTITFSDPQNDVRLQNNLETIGLAPGQIGGKPLHEITYTTKLAKDFYATNLTNKRLRNTAYADLYNKGNKVDSANDWEEITISNNMIKKDATKVVELNGTANPRVDFKITVNENKMPLTGVTVTDDLNKIITEFKANSSNKFQSVTDAKWAFITGTAKISINGGAAQPVNPTLDGSIIKFDLGSISDTYTITFTAELDMTNLEIRKDNGIIRCRNNIGTIESVDVKGGAVSSAPTGNIDFGNEVLNKSGSFNSKTQQIVWNFNINQNGFDLQSSEIVDILPKGLTLVKDSVKLYTDVLNNEGVFISGERAEKEGTPVAVTYDYKLSEEKGEEGQYVLTIKLPSPSTAYILRFATYVDDELLGKTISNKAFYKGMGNDSGSSVGNVYVNDSSSGGAGFESTVTVYKQDELNKPLAGAVFTLKDKVSGNEKTAHSNELGEVVFKRLTPGNSYTITEVEAPIGYILDATPKEFIAGKGKFILEDGTFINVAKKGALNLKAQKTLTGQSLTQDQFKFGIYENGNLLREATNQANGEILFTPIQYGPNQLGEKTYTVKEIIPEVAGDYTFDSTEYTVKVLVADDANSNTLQVELTSVTSSTNTAVENKTILFNNIYTAPEVPEVPNPPYVPNPPSRDNNGSTDDSLIDIFDEEVPLSDGSGLVDMLDEEIPLGNRPQTGDDTPLALYGSLLVVSAALWVLLKKRKKTASEE